MFSDTLLKAQQAVMIPRRNTFHFYNQDKSKEILAFKKYDRMEVTTSDRLSAAPFRAALENAWPMFFANPKVDIKINLLRTKQNFASYKKN